MSPLNLLQKLKSNLSPAIPNALFIAIGSPANLPNIGSTSASNEYNVARLKWSANVWPVGIFNPNELNLISSGR